MGATENLNKNKKNKNKKFDFIMEFFLNLSKLLRTIVAKCIRKLCIGLVR